MQDHEPIPDTRIWQGATQMYVGTELLQVVQSDAHLLVDAVLVDSIAHYRLRASSANWPPTLCRWYVERSR